MAFNIKTYNTRLKNFKIPFAFSRWLLHLKFDQSDFSVLPMNILDRASYVICRGALCDWKYRLTVLDFIRNFKTTRVYQIKLRVPVATASPQASVTMPEAGELSRYLFSHSSWGQKSRVRVAACLTYLEVFLLGLYAHVVLPHPWCPYPS